MQSAHVKRCYEEARWWLGQVRWWRAFAETRQTPDGRSRALNHALGCLADARRERQLARDLRAIDHEARVRVARCKPARYGDALVLVQPARKLG
jgi:hypothetical protein